MRAHLNKVMKVIQDMKVEFSKEIKLLKKIQSEIK